MDHSSLLAREFKLKPEQANAVCNALNLGLSAPYIARYAKDQTGGLPETLIRKFAKRAKALQALDAQRQNALKAAEAAGALSEELKNAIERATNKTDLEDLAAPFRVKKTGKGHAAEENGLKPLADLIWAQNALPEPLESLARNYLNGARAINLTEQVLEGVRSILVERVANLTSVRRKLRAFFDKECRLSVKAAKNTDEIPSRYQPFLNFNKTIHELSDADTMNIRRGVKRKLLKTSLEIDETKALTLVQETAVHATDAAVKFLLEAIATDAYHQILKPLIENDVRQRLNEHADKLLSASSIRAMQTLLTAPPLGDHGVLVLHPESATLAQAALVSQDGKLIESTTLDLSSDESQTTARTALTAILNRSEVHAAALATANHSEVFASLLRDVIAAGARNVPQLNVGETGASIFAESDLAKNEMPDASPVVRQSVFLARKLQDPIAALAPLDLLSVVSGRAQKESEHNPLTRELQDILQSIACRIGINLNTAPKALLAQLPGLNESLADAIVTHRTAQLFTKRSELLTVAGITPEIYQHVVGFLRVVGGAEPLDETAIHPQHYPVVARLAEKAGKSVPELVQNPGLLDGLKPEDGITENAGQLTVTDIGHALKNRGRPTRQPIELITFDPKIRTLNDLSVGQILNGRISNLTEFGAFVHIGIKTDGLVHKTEISAREIKDHTRYLRLGQGVRVKIIKVDLEQSRLELSIKQATPERKPRPEHPAHSEANAKPPREQRGPARHGKPAGPRGNDRKPAPPRKVFGTLGDQFKQLLKK